MRTTLAALAAAALLAAPAAAAPPKGAAISDKAGDWTVASQDITAVRLTSGRGRVHVAIDLAGAPDAATQYDVVFGLGCEQWGFAARNLGTDLVTATLGYYPCQDTVSYATSPGSTSRATVTAHGTTVELDAPYALGLRPGTRVTAMSAGAAVVFTGAYVGHDVGENGFVFDGDFAQGRIRYTFLR